MTPQTSAHQAPPSLGFSRQEHWSGLPFPSPQCRRLGSNPWVRKIPWRREWQPTPVILPGEVHGQRSLVGYSPWGHKESDTTERLALKNLILRSYSPYKSMLIFYQLIKQYSISSIDICSGYRKNFKRKRYSRKINKDANCYLS